MTIAELKFYFKLYGIHFKENQIDLLNGLMNFTLEENKKFNLTAIKNPNDFVEKMIFDSALLMKYFDFTNKKVIDVGTGAGFPGLVIDIMSDTNITLLDSTKKKIEHIKMFKNKNNLKCSLICDRCETYCLSHIEEYDYAVCRAVAQLNVLCEIISPMIKVGGYIVAMKGPNSDKEISLCENAFSKLGLKIEENYREILPLCKENRSIILIKKYSKTPAKYPREYKDIMNKPL